MIENVMVNFMRGEYMRKMFFGSLIQAPLYYCLV